MSECPTDCSSVRSAHKRIDKLEERLDNFGSINETVGRLDEKVDNLSKTTEEIKDDVKQINQKPSKYWDKILTAIITAIITGAAGYIISQLKK